MAARCDDDGDQLLSDAMCLMSVNEVRLKELGLDDNARAKLNEIENDYESIFSWDIKRLTGISQNLMSEVIDVAREKLEIIMVKDNVFNLNRFYKNLLPNYLY